jgi:formamidopyrimidine-DNA glycosylase
MKIHDAGALALPSLGPDPADPSFDVAFLKRALAKRRGPIKPALLDQRIASGVGNIYAVEGLWIAGIDPRTPASSLGPTRLARLIEGIRQALVLGEFGAGRYSEGDATGLEVYGREGEPCSRCGARIRRILQAGRSTYFCPGCQRR